MPELMHLDIRDESLAKNPIRNRMTYEKPHLPPDRLHATVARARDAFHSFIAGTIRRRYQRVPIYLVDSWIIGALGVFRMKPLSRGLEPASGKPPFFTMDDLSKPIPGFAAVVDLFRTLSAVRATAAGLRVVRISSILDAITKTCIDLLQLERQEHLFIEARDQCDHLLDICKGVFTTLTHDNYLGPLLDHDYKESFKADVHRLISAFERFRTHQPPIVPGISFDRERGSGLLLGSIPELDIEGPAILISPVSIEKWSRNWPEMYAIENSAPEDIERWFGVRNQVERTLSVAIHNVLHHEMTHAMVFLPNDHVGDPCTTLRSHWAFYAGQPFFDEGLANCTAVISTAVSLLKASFSIRGSSLPNLDGSKYGPEFDKLHNLFRATYASYYGEATDVFLNAWNVNKRDYGAFAGLVKMLATNFHGMDWLATYDALTTGKITTGQIEIADK